MAAADLVSLKDDVLTAIDAVDVTAARIAYAKFLVEYQTTPNLDNSASGINWRAVSEELRKMLDIIESTAGSGGAGTIQRVKLSRDTHFGTE